MKHSVDRRHRSRRKNVAIEHRLPNVAPLNRGFFIIFFFLRRKRLVFRRDDEGLAYRLRDTRQIFENNFHSSNTYVLEVHSEVGRYRSGHQFTERVCGSGPFGAHCTERETSHLKNQKKHRGRRRKKTTIIARPLTTRRKTRADEQLSSGGWTGDWREHMGLGAALPARPTEQSPKLRRRGDEEVNARFPWL